MTTPNPASPDPLEFVKALWGNLPTPMAGFVPTVDSGELDKRIADLKAVESWLQANTNMLRMTIQGLEVQRATLAALQATAKGEGASHVSAMPAFDVSNWPLNFLQAGASMFGAPPAEAAAAPRARKSRRKSAT